MKSTSREISRISQNLGNPNHRITFPGLGSQNHQGSMVKKKKSHMFVLKYEHPE